MITRRRVIRLKLITQAYVFVIVFLTLANEGVSLNEIHKWRFKSVRKAKTEAFNR